MVSQAAGAGNSWPDRVSERVAASPSAPAQKQGDRMYIGAGTVLLILLIVLLIVIF
jgi:hypothetical protein